MRALQTRGCLYTRCTDLGQKVPPETHFSAICLFHPTGRQSSALCFDRPRLPNFQPINLLVYPFALTPTWSVSSGSSRAFLHSTAPPCSKARLCSSPQSVGDCSGTSHPSPALGILLTQSETDEVIHNQLQVRRRQEAWNKSRRGILPSAKGKDASVPASTFPPHPG